MTVSTSATTTGAAPGGLACLARGARSLRANPALGVVAALQNLLLLGLTAVSIVVPLAILDALEVLDPPFGLPLDQAAIQDWVDALVGIAFADGGRQLAALGVILVLGLVTVVLWCWLQAGLVGLLHRAERSAAEASPAEGTPAEGALADLEARRVTTRDAFVVVAAERYRDHVGFVHWSLLVGTLPLLAWALVQLVATLLVGPGGAGLVVLLLVSMLGLVVVGATQVAWALWTGFGLAALGRPGTTTRDASRRARRVLVRRFGTGLVVALAPAAAGIGVTLLASLVGLVAGVVLPEGLDGALSWLLGALQTAVGGVVGLWFFASALVVTDSVASTAPMDEGTAAAASGRETA